MKRLSATAFLVLSACVQPLPGMSPGTPPAADACGAGSLQGLVGQSSTVLAVMTFPAPTRVIRPGMPVTMDFREDRLNIEVNAAGSIARVFCG